MSDTTTHLPFLALVALMLALQPAAASGSPRPLFPRTSEPVIAGPIPIPTAAKRPQSNLPPELKAVRKRLLAGEKVTYQQLQELADKGDSIGAFRLAERIQKQADPKLATDALHYFTMAAQQDRDYAVRRMVDILSRDHVAIKPAHLKQAETALRTQANKGNAQAIEALIKFYSDGKPFGARRDQLEALLAAGAGAENAEAAFRLAVLLLSDPQRSADQTEQATRYLMLASQNGSIGIKASASNLLATLSVQQANDNSEVQQ